MSRIFALSSVSLFVVALVASSAARATNITINDPVLELENYGYNPLGDGTGDGSEPGYYLRFGANSVTPNGNNGTTGTGFAKSQSGQTLFNYPMFFAPSIASPNFFNALIPSTSPDYSTGLTANWLLQFNNGGNSNSVTLSLPAGASQINHIATITISGNGSSPTFTWTPPANSTVTSYEVGILDGNITTGNQTVVAFQFLSSSTTSYTINPAQLLAAANLSGNGTDNYVLDIRSANVTGANVQTANGGNTVAITGAIADTFVPFRLLSSSSPPNVYLPTYNANGSYQFSIPVVSGQTYDIDPALATGYTYDIGAGDPNFASVTPLTDVGNGIYQLWVEEGGHLVEVDSTLSYGQTFDFLTSGFASGVSEFAILGINPGLDPNDSTAFITGLTFDGSGTFNGTQTPVTTPLPAALLLFGSGLGAIGLLGWRRKRETQPVTA